MLTTALAKSALACALHGAGVAALRRRRQLPLILAYHQVVDDFARSARSGLPSMLISRSMLARQLEWLGRRFRFVSLDEAAELVQQPAGHRMRPAVAITFDDGYRQVHELALPLLLRMGVPATVFVVSGSIGEGAIFVHDRLVDLLRRGFPRWRRPAEELRRRLEQAGVARRDVSRFVLPAASSATVAPRLLAELPGGCLRRLLLGLERDLGPAEAGEHAPLSWEMLVDLQRAGITIGSHTRSHVWMRNEPPETLLREAVESRRELAQRLGRSVEHFAYPGGSFDPVAVQAVARAGYRFAYTICWHRDPLCPLLTIPRRVFWERTCLNALERFSGAMMSCQTSGVFDRCPGPHERRFAEAA